MKQYCKKEHDTFVVGRDIGGHCKACERINSKNRSIRPLYKAIAKRSKIQHWLKLKTIKKTLKSVPCTDCHKKYPHYVMDFDHRMSKKCDVVCANCHRIRTRKRSKGHYGN